MSTWQEFRDALSTHSALFSAQPDLVASYQNVYQDAQTEDRAAVTADMYVLFSAVAGKVQPAGVDAAVNSLMAMSGSITAAEGDPRPDKYPYTPKL